MIEHSQMNRSTASDTCNYGGDRMQQGTREYDRYEKQYVLVKNKDLYSKG